MGSLNQVEDAMLGQQIEQYNEAISRLHYQRMHHQAPNAVVNAAVQAAASIEADVAQALLDISATSTAEAITTCTTSGFH